MAGYDRALTVFSPDGKLFQVDYAHEAVKKGATALGIRCADCVVLCVEKAATPKLQEQRSIQKIVQVDSTTAFAFAGLTADARILCRMAREEVQSHRLALAEVPPVESVASYVARVQQAYTHRGGVRPFGLSTLVAGVTALGKPALFGTDPGGSICEWLANAVGKHGKVVIEALEKHHRKAEAGEDTALEQLTPDAGVRVALRALSEVVDATAQNLDVAVVGCEGVNMLAAADIQKHLDALKAEDDA